MKLLVLLPISIYIMILSQPVHARALRVATFNVSMEATNYLGTDEQASGLELFEQLQTGKNLQIRNIAEIIQRVRPDIILLNEFDYNANVNKGLKAFITRYLNVALHDQITAIDYPHFYVARVNTGVDSGLDLNKNGIASGKGADAFGFGFFPGHYGMAILSKYPIDINSIRTFQHFLWKDMPNGFLDTIKDERGESWYSEDAKKIFRLSSKSHWDVPILVNGKVLHVLASHPTPPVFDGPEDRNGKRNHDEIRFWLDYISGGESSAYIYDDKGKYGGLNGTNFVLLGDLNSSVDEGDAHKGAISALLKHCLLDSTVKPSSKGGMEHSPSNSKGQYHTAEWGMRADYVLPSNSLRAKGSGVFWPSQKDVLHRLTKTRNLSSDHRLVWVDLHL